MNLILHLLVNSLYRDFRVFTCDQYIWKSIEAADLEVS